MITSSDMIGLPYTPDLSEGGIAYACRWLASTFERMGDSPAERLRSRSGGAAVELAFRRYLTTQAVPFEVREGTPFSQPGHYTLWLGGHRCDVISYLISRDNQVTQLRQDPGSLLQAPALLPLELFAAARIGCGYAGAGGAGERGISAVVSGATGRLERPGALLRSVRSNDASHPGGPREGPMCGEAWQRNAGDALR